MNHVLTVVCWKWKDPKWPNSFDYRQVNTLASMVSRNLEMPHKIVCVTDDAAGIDLDIGIVPMWKDLAHMGHCYRRLKAFSTEAMLLFGPRFLSLDLDSVICGGLDELIPEKGCDFKILKDTQPPTPYNGSMFFVRHASRTKIWREFNPSTSPQKAAKKGYAACDQAWIAECLGINEPVWTQKDGLYSYRNDIKNTYGGALPDNAKAVFFHGKIKPWQEKTQKAHLWVVEHYKDTRKRLVVIGGADCALNDFNNYSPPKDAKVMVINDMGTKFSGKIDYWVSLHPEKLVKWENERKAKGYNQDYITVGYGNVNQFENRVPKNTDEWTDDWAGSSGLFGAKIGLEKGFDHIVLCGIPMDKRPNMFRPNKEWLEAQGFRVGWENHWPDLMGKVFSMSGWTKEILNP